MNKNTEQKTKESWRKKCVKLAKDIVKTKSGYKCEYCGKKKPDVSIHGSHVYEEGTYRSMSADTDNIITLCYTHHIGGWNTTQPSWHGNPLEMVEWYKEHFPVEYDALKLRSRETKVCDLQFWMKKHAELKEELEGL